MKLKLRHRSAEQVVRGILRYCMSPRKITKILQHLHLQGQMGYKRIKELKEFNLLEEERIPGYDSEQGQKRTSQYRTTPKGREYVELYNRLTQLYPSVSPNEKEIEEDSMF